MTTVKVKWSTSLHFREKKFAETGEVIPQKMEAEVTVTDAMRKEIVKYDLLSNLHGLTGPEVFIPADIDETDGLKVLQIYLNEKLEREKTAKAKAREQEKVFVEKLKNWETRPDKDFVEFVSIYHKWEISHYLPKPDAFEGKYKDVIEPLHIRAQKVLEKVNKAEEEKEMTRLARIAEIEKWVKDHGSDLLKARLAGNYNWKEMWFKEYATSLFPEGIHQTKDLIHENELYENHWETGDPTLEQIRKIEEFEKRAETSEFLELLDSTLYRFSFHDDDDETEDYLKLKFSSPLNIECELYIEV